MQDEQAIGGVVINPATALGKELAKWEQHPSHLIGRGMTPGNPYQYRPYPKMIFRAVKKSNGKVVCMEGEPPLYLFKDAAEYERACNEARVLENQCNKTVQSEAEWLVAKGQGWCESPAEAIAQYEREQQAIGDAAAEVNYQVRRMSAKAQAEHQEATEATHEHVTDVTPASKKKQREQAAAGA